MKFVLWCWIFHLFFHYLFFFSFIGSGRFILFLLRPHPGQYPKTGFLGVFPELLLLFSLRVPDQISGCLEKLAPWQFAADSPSVAPWRFTLVVFSPLAYTHGTQRQSAVCQVPAGQCAYCFWKSRPDPQTLGSTQQSL